MREASEPEKQCHRYETHAIAFRSTILVHINKMAHLLFHCLYKMPFGSCLSSHPSHTIVSSAGPPVAEALATPILVTGIEELFK